MTHKAAKLDAGDTLLLSNLDKSWFLHFNEYNNVPIPIPAYYYIVKNRSLSCNCELQGGHFLHESLASYPSTEKVSRKYVLYNQHGLYLSTANEFS